MTDFRSELAWLVERFKKYLWCVEHEWGGEIEEYDAEESRADAILSMTDWQKIETAPKDGTTFLANFPFGFDIVRYKELGDFGEPVWEGSRGCAQYILELPTHWMNMPEPPK